MASRNILITGSSGLVGSECVRYFDDLGWNVCGVDNNMRKQLFGSIGDTTTVVDDLKRSTKRFKHVSGDIRDRKGMFKLIELFKPDALVHCAAQPSHDLSAKIPEATFAINTLGTMNLLEGTRQYAPDCTFVFMSTNKVYGDTPNCFHIVERRDRYDFTSRSLRQGLGEMISIDHSTHSPFGASKLAADVMVQEYGRYFGIKTACLRAGCITGSAHRGAELHGFLSYLVRCIVRGVPYTIYGYNGKQVRDNIHGYDVCTAVHEIVKNPGHGDVYNIGGGRKNSVSVIEAIRKIEKISGKKAIVSYSDEVRVGDHKCYFTDNSKLMERYPEWSVSRNLTQVLNEMVNNEARAFTER